VDVSIKLYVHSHEQENAKPKVQIKMKNDTTKVGIFFKVENDFLIDAVQLTEDEPYGEAIQYGGHYDFHESFATSTPHKHQFTAHDYDYYPRGRVVYFPN
jgi:hypothetical protein